MADRLRRPADAVLALSKAFALASASDEARDIRDEIGFFQAVRAALAKNDGGGGKSKRDMDLAVQQIISRAIVSTGIVDILEAAGLDSPDISILSDEFLEDVRQMEKKNLVLEELIRIAKDLKAADARGEALGLTPEEWAFYQALADNESAREVMGDRNLAVIAQELLNGVRRSTGVDWMHRDAARARIRLLTKKVLKKHGYPPDLADGAVRLVLEQAEALAAEWAYQ